MRLTPYRGLLRHIHMLLISSLLVSACGGGSNSTIAGQANLSDNASDQTPIIAPVPAPIPPRITNARGALLNDGELRKTNSIVDSTQAIREAADRTPDVIPLYEVKQYRLTYLTPDKAGNLITASGIVAVPQKPAGVKSPLLSFQHGTIFYDRDAPSNDTDAESPVNILASLGYIVVAADYVGYGASSDTPHPYLQRDPSANAVIDFITASRQWLAEQRLPLNEQLFLTGYSEGGYVTLAAQQTLEAAGTPITASVAGAGPYDLRYTLDNLLGKKALLASAGNALGFGRPAPAAKYPGKFDELLVDTLLYFLIPENSDAEFDKTFLLDWMADDYDTLYRNSVYEWQAKTPTRLTHGRDDTTVPFGNATRALEGMRAKGTPDLDLTECVAAPSDHTNCIKPYAQTMLQYFGGFARDL
ncbi:alpha/beta hydrolase family protein [Thiothrix subterranea]|uniref:Prolyl oligopeptidase family serine peptidase n=1 Tax=Thiothrix subterranea TaxID=2735563 RepID=A0AA51MQI8_9GAMM|nr:prolyl oligopeptidase family serine peptidase [Thiothrix subterranea]MDQ5769732.1 prolyl oligopeptidase family serine peptidase [Thiothrix subterranea]WML88525.1 prolyl oligopeptidase family serine peptidase [Thiothrix subterranea]